MTQDIKATIARLRDGFFWIPEYEGLYAINKLGEVLSFTINKKGKPLKHRVSLGGYPEVTLSKEGVAKGKRIHRLMAQTFIPNPENKPHINHKNAVRTDFSLENLEWCTPKENYDHAVKMGNTRSLEELGVMARQNGKKGARKVGATMRRLFEEGRLNVRKGQQMPSSKLSPEKAKEIVRLSKQGVSRKTLSLTFGIAVSNVRCILIGEHWSHVTGVSKKQTIRYRFKDKITK